MQPIRTRTRWLSMLVVARKPEQFDICLMAAERIAECRENQYPMATKPIREQLGRTMEIHGLPRHLALTDLFLDGDNPS